MAGGRFGLRIMRIIVAAAFVPVLATCGGGGGGGGDSGAGGGGGGQPSNTITITGNFTGGTNSSLLDRVFARLFPSAYALAANEVTRAIAIAPDGTTTSSNVTSGSFSLAAATGVPVGAIFVGASDNFLGYVSFGGGIDTLPLGKMRAGANTINLQALSSSGQTVLPAHNPIGQELPLTPEEQAAIKQANALFSVVVRNPDVDSNGRVDALEGKHFGLTFFYDVRAGAFGGSLVPSVDPVPTFTEHKLQLYVKDTNPAPATVFITGPAGSGLVDQPVSRNALLNPLGTSATYFLSGISVPPIPLPGTYTVRYNSQTLTFNVPDQSAVTSNIVLPVPTVTLNSNGSVQRVNWVYRLASGGATLDPSAFMQRVEVSFLIVIPPAPSGDQCIFGANIVPTVTEFVPQCQTPLNWSSVGRVEMRYVDLYGNLVTVGWQM